MADVSNRTLMFLLGVAILVTVVGTWYSISSINKFVKVTGYGEEGEVSVNITQRIKINVTQPYCSFGKGYVHTDYTKAILYPNCTNNAGDTKTGWVNEGTYNPDCMVLRNEGNWNLSINVSSSAGNADNFIGGNPALNAYKVWSENKDADACGSDLVNHPGAEFSNSEIMICSNLGYLEAEDEMYVGCYLEIPEDAYGYKEDTWTFEGTAIA